MEKNPRPTTLRGSAGWGRDDGGLHLRLCCNQRPRLPKRLEAESHRRIHSTEYSASDNQSR